MRLVVKNNPYRYRDYSYIAAQAALAARDQGKFAAMHRLLLERSPALDRASLMGYAKELGLDLGRFARDLDRQAHKSEIDGDIRQAEELDLYNTPAFFINGVKLVGDRPYDSFKAVVDRELGHASGKGRR